MLTNLPFAAGVGSTLLSLHLLVGGVGKRPWPNRYLGAFFLLFAAQLFVLSYQLNAPHLHLGPYRIALILAANPMAFLFFRSLRPCGHAAPRALDGLHFLPVPVVPVLLILDVGTALDALLFCSMAGYGAVYLLALRRGPQQFSTAPEKAFRWLQVFAIFYPFSALLDAGIALELLGNVDLRSSQLLPIAILIVFATTLLLVFGAMGRRPLFDWLQEVTSAKARPSVSEEELDNLAAHVRSVICTEPVFSDADLSLTRFARRIGKPPRRVSQAINRRLGMSFSDLLNGVRIDAAKRLLVDTEWRGRSVTDIAYEVGFHSKSNFHRAFKQQTGITPRMFRSNAARSD